MDTPSPTKFKGNEIHGISFQNGMPVYRHDLSDDLKRLVANMQKLVFAGLVENDFEGLSVDEICVLAEFATYFHKAIPSIARKVSSTQSSDDNNSPKYNVDQILLAQRAIKANDGTVYTERLRLLTRKIVQAAFAGLEAVLGIISDASADGEFPVCRNVQGLVSSANEAIYKRLDHT